MHDTSRSDQVQDSDQQYSNRGKLSHDTRGPAIFQLPRKHLELRYQGQQLLQVNTLTHSIPFVCPPYSFVYHLLTGHSLGESDILGRGHGPGGPNATGSASIN